jgi:hypothetical protein
MPKYVSHATGLDKSDVGLGNVDNTSDATLMASVDALVTARILDMFARYDELSINVVGGSYAAVGTGVTDVSTGVFALSHERVIDNGDGSFTILTFGPN